MVLRVKQEFENVIVNLQKELWIWKDASGNFESAESAPSDNPDAKNMVLI